MRKLITLFILTALVIALSGCTTAPPRKNPLKTLMIDECAEQRRSGTGFNARKSYQLVWYECQQLMVLNTDYRKIDDRHYRKNPNITGFEEQEDFDAETWFFITEVMRKKYYPDYLEPEQEVIRARVLEEQQGKTITDKSLLRDWQPRLLPVSPYLMSHKQLGLAQDAVSDLIHEKRGDEFFTKLMVIDRIMVNEGIKKDPYRRHY